MAIFIVLDPESRRSEGCENCAVPQPPQRAQKRCSLGTPVRDSDLFPTSPSTPPSAPCWAKLFRAYGAGFSASKFQVSFSHTLPRLASTLLSVPTFPPLWLLKMTTAAEAIFLIRVERGAKAQLYPGLRAQWF